MVEHVPAETPAPLMVESPTNGVARVVLNSVSTRNALSLDMMAALQSALETLAENQQTRCIILGAAGPVFCAGHNLKELTAERSGENGGANFYTRTFNTCANLMMAITNLTVPVIGEVQGTATAAGCQLVATCDLAVAADHARFATPGVNIGLFCSTPMVPLSRNVSAKSAMEMLLTGDAVDAETALRMGLVNKVVAPEQLRSTTDQLARKIATKPRATIATGKQAFYRQRDLPLEQAYAYTAQVMVENMATADAVEGIGAFLEKRSPNWPSNNDTD